jgi:hypothetical protein
MGTDSFCMTLSGISEQTLTLKMLFASCSMELATYNKYRSS